MKNMFFSALGMLLLILSGCNSAENYRTLSLEAYQSKMQAGWLGQMAGVGWGAPTEFQFNSVIIPEDKVPNWETGMVNQHYQDDIYVEMTFLKTLEDYGFDVSIRQAGIDFANSEYQLWHANRYGRENLRSGIAPPFSGHPEYNAHADDIDYQIEADYSGLIAPGMPQTVIELGEKFGRLMNYGDGLYGGQFVGAMYAEAFFETNIHKIIDAGLACIPEESMYTEAVRDVILWYEENPDNWKLTWQLVEDKYNLNPDYRKFSCNGTDPSFNIDAKINGAYIVMGLLYGQGDMDKTILVSMRCGQDSDCNPSNAAGILATSMGMENLPEKYKENIDMTTKFSYTAYDFPGLLEVCETLAREAVLKSGGRVELDDSKGEVFVIPRIEPVVSKLEQCWEASEITEDVYFTEAEMDQILIKIRRAEEFVALWKISGPYSKDGLEGPQDLLDEAFAPEKEKSFNEWTYFNYSDKGIYASYLDLNEYYHQQHCVVYLQTEIWAPEERAAVLEIGSDDGFMLWVNARLEQKNNVVRSHNQGDDKVAVNLKNGWNEVVLKVSQGDGGWGASMVIADKEGEVIDGLKFR